MARNPVLDTFSIERVPLTDEQKAAVKQELIEALGKDRVSDNKAVMAAYRGETSHLVHVGPMPDFVVMPTTVEHVQAILRIANRHKVPVIPIAYASAHPSCIAWSGGIIVDMMKMNKILDINTDDDYALVEPGVTFNQLIPELRKSGYRIGFGSYPQGNSVYGNTAGARSFDHSMSGLYPDQCLALEVVLPNGSVIRTGSATYGNRNWFVGHERFLPDVKGLFSPSFGAMGIVTKAAVRIYPEGEAQALPIAGFNQFADTIKYVREVSRAGISEQTMGWSWLLVLAINCLSKGSEDVAQYLNSKRHRNVNDVPEGMYYNYVWTATSGYTEQVQANVKVCERLARKFNGRLIPEDEFGKKFPNTLAYWKHAYVDHTASNAVIGLFHDGSIRPNIFFGSLPQLGELEPIALERLLKEHHIRNVTYYTRIYDRGRAGHLRFILNADVQDDEEIEETRKRHRAMNAFVKKNFPDLEVPGAGYDSPYHYAPLFKKIQRMLDPNGIMNPAIMERLFGEVSDDV